MSSMKDRLEIRTRGHCGFGAKVRTRGIRTIAIIIIIEGKMKLL
jgi:hypothetical protein